MAEVAAAATLEARVVVLPAAAALTTQGQINAMGMASILDTAASRLTLHDSTELHLRTLILVEAAVAGACNNDLAALHRGALAERGLALPRRPVEGGAAAACIGPRGRRWWE